MDTSDVKSASSGNTYDIRVLHDGRDVISRAILYGIQHKTSQAELALKIGRYKKVKGLFGITNEKPEAENPKSELTLSGEETTALLAFLKEKAGLVVEGPGKYVKVADDDLAGLLAEINSRLGAADRAQLLPLIQGGKFLPKDVFDVALLRSRQDAVDQFEQLLNSNAKEQDFQSWFQGNPWVLGTDCVRILDERRIDVENIADYLVEAYDGHADIVEIKRPSLEFWSPERDHDNLVPHVDLIKAITQTQNYQFELEREMDSKKTEKRLGGVPISRPRSLLIHGRSEKWSDEHCSAQRLLNSGLTSLQVLTYDQVLRRAKRMLS